MRSERVRRDYLLAATVLAASEVAGMLAIVRAYHIGQHALTSGFEFSWFWAGMSLLLLPPAALIARWSTPPAVRTALLILYGLVSYAPKLLRNPVGPLYHDEYAHWRQTFEILTTGRLFQPNPIISIIARFPGLHAATAALVNATGLGIWQAATILLAACHVALLLGVAALARSLGLNNRAASLVAVLYSLNSSFLYFDTQYAYESMAITLVVWTLVGYIKAIRTPAGRGRAAWCVLTLLLAAGTVVTHHLSTFTLVAIMALVALIMSVPWLARRGGWLQTAGTAWALTLVTALMAVAWFGYVAPTTYSYLSPFLGQGFSELMQVARGSGTARQLFGASLSPWWEQKSAYLVPVFALGLAAGGLLLIRARARDGGLPAGRRRGLMCAFAVLGLVYFPSTIFILSPAGAEGARRSWAFTWFGLCVLSGLAVVWLLDWSWHRGRQWLRVSLYSGLTAALAIAMIGGTAAGLDASYRFPGPFLYGSDARSVTSELLGTSRWFTARFGVHNNVITDRYTGLIFGSLGLQNTASPSAGFPVYNLYLAKPGQPIKPSFLLFDLGLSHYTYLIVDRRMEYQVPELGMYFTPDEPAAQFQPHDGRSVFYGRLGKFSTTPWMIKVFQSDNYIIYRLNLPAAAASYQPQPPPSGRGKLPQGRFLVTP
ncbi:MAG TPA: hypothetical protein VH637_19510 [Streptosporangiaceae bacterium]|jgi:hypothetical protein